MDLDYGKANQLSEEAFIRVCETLGLPWWDRDFRRQNEQLFKEVWFEGYQVGLAEGKNERVPGLQLMSGEDTSSP